MKRFVIQKKYKRNYTGERNPQYNNWCNHRCYETITARDREYGKLESDIFKYRKK